MSIPDKTPKGSGKENYMTPGRIETGVANFNGSITGESPMSFIYGEHKTPGSQGAPIKLGGRGGSKPYMRKNLNEMGGGS